jgi:hypothetical protein
MAFVFLSPRACLCLSRYHLLLLLFVLFFFLWYILAVFDGKGIEAHHLTFVEPFKKHSFRNHRPPPRSLVCWTTEYRVFCNSGFHYLFIYLFIIFMDA